jgi:hypothetical protein
VLISIISNDGGINFSMLNNCKKLFLVITIIIVGFTAGCSADGGRVTVKEILKRNPDADIIQYDNGKVYSNVTNLEWFQKEKGKYSKERFVGEVIKRTTSRFMYKDYYATKLPVGSRIYSIAKENRFTGILIVEHEGEDLYYMVLLEG